MVGLRFCFFSMLTECRGHSVGLHSNRAFSGPCLLPASILSHHNCYIAICKLKHIKSISHRPYFDSGTTENLVMKTYIITLIYLWPCIPPQIGLCCLHDGCFPFPFYLLKSLWFSNEPHNVHYWWTVNIIGGINLDHRMLPASKSLWARGIS